MAHVRKLDQWRKTNHAAMTQFRKLGIDGDEWRFRRRCKCNRLSGNSWEKKIFPPTRLHGVFRVIEEFYSRSDNIKNCGTMPCTYSVGSSGVLSSAADQPSPHHRHGRCCTAIRFWKYTLHDSRNEIPGQLSSIPAIDCFSTNKAHLNPLKFSSPMRWKFKNVLKGRHYTEATAATLRQTDRQIYRQIIHSAISETSLKRIRWYGSHLKPDLTVI